MANRIATTIGPNTQAQRVREELFQLTAQQEWNRDDYWKFFLRGRRDIFDAIYDEFPEKDWLNPATAQRVDNKFVERAQERWGGWEERWALEGGWLTNRPDMVAWLRSTYWKHNKKRITERQHLAAQTVPTATPTTAGGQGEVGDVSNGPAAGQGGDGGDTGGKTWRDVVLQ